MDSLLDMLVDPLEITSLPKISKPTPFEPRLPDILRPYPFNNPSMVAYVANPELLRQTKLDTNAMDKLIKATGTDKKYWDNDYDVFEEFTLVAEKMAFDDTIRLQSIINGTNADVMAKCKKIYDLADIIVFKDLLRSINRSTCDSIKVLLKHHRTFNNVISVRLSIYLSYYFATTVTIGNVTLPSRFRFFKTIVNKINEFSGQHEIFKYFTNEELTGYKKIFADAKVKYYPTL